MLPLTFGVFSKDFFDLSKLYDEGNESNPVKVNVEANFLTLKHLQWTMLFSTVNKTLFCFKFGEFATFTVEGRF